ncbi:hypothetical protein [Pararhizobium antarcticum]|uniref:Uncharacterized protein n=1 Tax=Pararhizobium antarcticum TaxID=1798805 RepID=A0A657LU81_9HYPH|nr:hypothetical protein [Pararhizobium antarcticum]OJF91977.1 hypothetical protein AX761_05675 [Rhizobium sp. 58]OJF98360.1 hypothetical protein AX760_14735 [Pararhizobium antarcticum]
MGQIYHLTEDQDDLLSEAEKAFDLSARRQSIGWSNEQKTVDDRAPGAFDFLSGWLRRVETDNHIG